MAELDLTPKPGGGDEPKPEGERSERSKRRDRQREREQTGNLAGRLQAIFDRLAQRFEGKGDAELAAIIREDSRAMVGGLVSLTKRVPGAASPILLLLGVVEPVLAFGRLFRVLAGRWAARRYAPVDELDEQPEPGSPFCGNEACELGPESWHLPHEHTPDGVLYI